MKRTLTFRLGGVRTHLAGLDEPVRERLRRRYQRFLEEGPYGDSADLVISVRPAPFAPFGDSRVSGRGPVPLSTVAPDPRGGARPVWSAVRTPSMPPAPVPLSGTSGESHRMESELKGDRVLLRSASFAGSFSLAGGEGELLLRGNQRDLPHESIESFLRVALSWRLLLRQAVLVRAIGILDPKRRAHVLVSPLDWTAMDRERLSEGAPLLSDEYLILDRREGRLMAHALPASHEAETLGAWPDRLPGYLTGLRPNALRGSNPVEEFQGEPVEASRTTLPAGPGSGVYSIAPGAQSGPGSEGAPVAAVYIAAGIDLGFDKAGAAPPPLTETQVTAAVLACLPHVNANARGASRAIGIVRSLLVGVPVRPITRTITGSFLQAISG